MRLNHFITILSILFIFGCSHVQAIKTRQDVLLKAQAIKLAAVVNQPEVAKETKSTQPTIKKLPEYEELTYKAKYLGMTVGSMTSSIKGIEKINGRDAYKFELTAKTEGLFAKAFKVEDRYVSYMDVEKLCVLRQEEYRQEGHYRKSSIVDFDHEHHKAHYRHLTDGTTKTIDIPTGVLDVVTANYYFRMIPWELGDTVNFKIYANEKVYDLIGLIRSKVKLSSGRLGKQEAFAMEPYALLDGEMVKEGNAVGYFAASELRAPLRGEVNTPVFGKASVTLHRANYNSP